MTKRLACTISILLLGLSFISTAFSASTPAPAIKKPIVSVETVKLSRIYDVLSYPARVIPKINASILSETEGVVQKILAPLGQRVSKGQRLMIIVNTDPVYNYAPVVVSASVNGVVSKLDVTEGSRVAKGQPLVHITDPSQVMIEVEIAASDLAVIVRGLRGEFNTALLEGTIPVEVTGVSPFVDPATGTATARLRTLQTAGNAIEVPPGIIGQVKFRVHDHEGFQIPEFAVFYRGKDPYVRELKDGKVRFVPVTLSQTRGGLVEIQKGLRENMTLVLRSSQYAGDGEEAEIQK